VPLNRERQIFEACRQLDPEGRESFIKAECGSDAKLAERIGRLLAAHDRAELDPTASTAGERRVLEDPTVIGPYRILERVGEGGMGVVYLAEQTRPIKRLVAIKIVKLGMDTKDVLARFDSERQALALMNHPNIARILDAGTTDTGRPYFVMEYVRGTSIVEYCDQRRLDVDSRMRLFTDVCFAVEHAHQKGVIHRDLKRSNILVTEEDRRPYPKVIDFGIAKATSQRLTDMTLHTQMGHVVGTPEYMSPEQAGGSGDVDTRTDVYSLGVVLYELLIGVRPFDFGDGSGGVHEILRTIREDDPLPPSARLTQLADSAPDLAERRSASVAELTRGVRGDLDLITMTALSKAPDRRYASAAALATDIQQFLSDQPVAAEAPSLWSRMRTFTRRNRSLVTVAVVVALSAAAIGVGNSFRSSTAVVEAAPRVLVLPFEYLGPEAEAYLASGISEEISHRLSGLTTLTVLGRQTAVFAASNAMTLEQMSNDLQVDFILDGTVRVQPVAEGPDSLRIRASLTDTQSFLELWTNTYAGSVNDLFGAQTTVASGVVQAVGIQLPATEERKLFTQPTDDLQAYDYFLRAKNFAGRSEQESDMRTALELFYEAAELDPDFAPAWSAVSVMRSRIRWRGYDATNLNLGLANEAGERALSINPDDADGHFALGYYNYYGFRDYDAALANFLAADERRPNDPEILYALGLVYRRRGDWDSAVSALRAAASVNPRHAQVAISLAETFLALGQYEESEAFFDQILEIAPNRPGIHLFKAWLYLATAPDTDAAIGAIRRGVETVGATQLFGLLGRYVSSADWWMSRVLASDERYQRWFESADPIAAGVDSVYHYLHSAQFYGALDRPQVSIAYHDSARTLLQTKLSIRSGDQRPGDLSLNDRSRRSDLLTFLGVSYAGLGFADSAINAASEGAALFDETFDALHGSEGWLQLALIHGMLGDRETAIQLLERVMSKPSVFRLGMLRHDPTFAPMLEDPRLQRLMITP
jgi:serine/threonine protein kinase/tetratricopeptide (TPR) repeat protein